jgi:hypothetical protein
MLLYCRTQKEIALAKPESRPIPSRLKADVNSAPNWIAECSVAVGEQPMDISPEILHVES